MVGLFPGQGFIKIEESIADNRPRGVFDGIKVRVARAFTGGQQGGGGLRMGLEIGPMLGQGAMEDQLLFRSRRAAEYQLESACQALGGFSRFGQQ